MRTKPSVFTLSAFGLVALVWAGLRLAGNATPIAAGGQTFRASAEVVATAPHLQVKLSVTNVSGQDQTFWAATSDCTQEHWKTDDPNIRVFDYCRVHTKICRTACEHHMTLHPGATFSEVVTPVMGRGTRLGRRTIKFADYQPDLALTDGSPLSSSRKYEPRVYSSEPVTLTIRQEWLSRS